MQVPCHRYTLIEQSNISIEQSKVEANLFLANSMLFTFINQTATTFDHYMMHSDFLNFAI